MDFTLEVKYDRTNMTYRPNDMITGHVKVNFPEHTYKKVDVQNFAFRAEGLICSQNKDTNKDLEKMSNMLPPLILFLSEGKLTKENSIYQDKNIFPFKIPFQPYQDRSIIETYVGVYIAVAYEIQFELKLATGALIKQSAPFFVQVPGQGRERVKEEPNMPPIKREDQKLIRAEPFKITPEKLFSNTLNKPTAKFRLSGTIDSTICSFVDDFHGNLTIDECDSDIRTIDIQLIRVEKIESKIGRISEATEIQLIQIVEGNATRNIEIPFNMIFPKYFSCPNFSFRDYTVDFEVNLIMILFDGFKVTLNFPINVIRM